MHRSLAAIAIASTVAAWRRIEQMARRLDGLDGRVDELERTVDDGFDTILDDLGRPAT